MAGPALSVLVNWPRLIWYNDGSMRCHMGRSICQNLRSFNLSPLLPGRLSLTNIWHVQLQIFSCCLQQNVYFWKAYRYFKFWEPVPSTTHTHSRIDWIITTLFFFFLDLYYVLWNATPFWKAWHMQSINVNLIWCSAGQYQC